MSLFSSLEKGEDLNFSSNKCRGCGNLIIGTCYTSQKIKNFHLCRKCHRTKLKELFMENHPFKSNSSGSDPERVVIEKDPVHKDTGCDGCDMQPIVGTRFRCLSRTDYDLCSSCFRNKSDELDVNKHKWAEYRKPGVLNRTIDREEESRPISKGFAGMKMRVPIHDSDPLIHEKIICDNCDMDPIQGSRYRCLSRVDYDLCEKCWGKRDTFGMYYQKWGVYNLPGVLISVHEKPTPRRFRMGGKIAPRTQLTKPPEPGSKLLEAIRNPRYNRLPGKVAPRTQLQKPPEPPKRPRDRIQIRRTVGRMKRPQHLRIKCNKCLSTGFFGTRYKCLSKPGVNLCEYCFENRLSVKSPPKFRKQKWGVIGSPNPNDAHSRIIDESK